MKFLINTIFLVFFVFCGAIYGQKNLNETQNITKVAKNKSSNIISSTQIDSVLIKVELNNAHYDFSKNNLPFFIVSKITPYNQNASPSLIIKKIEIVSEPHASHIKKQFSKFLTKNFEIISIASLAKNENLNHHQLIPFRLNNLNQIEELVDYEINWQTSIDNNRKLTNVSTFKNNSVLATGEWYKIAITKTGFHKIDKAFLAKIGMNFSNLNPKNIRIYGNGGRMLPELNAAFRYDDLEENAIQVIGEGDGSFDDTDYILFYAKDATGWTHTKSVNGLKFRHDKNIYSDTSFYFINTNLGAGKRVSSPPLISNVPNVTTSSYDYYNYTEKNIVNFVKSGRQFYGEYFDITTSFGFNWNDGDFFVNDTIISEVTMAGRGSNGGTYLVNGSGLNYTLSTAAVNITNYLADYVDVQTSIGKGLLNDPNSINLTISKQTSNCIAWLDKITINARRKLNINIKQFEFRDTRISKLGNICSYNFINTTSTNPIIWNVTDPINPYNQQYTTAGSNITFTANADSLNVYAVLPNTDFFSPTFVSKVANQNLHNIQQADYVLITHPLFISQAQRLAAIHQQHEGLTYAIATIDDIYNEFSSGRPDICGIRDFIRMIYSRNIASGKEVRYVILIGDGSYNNINRNIYSNSNLIPTYQTYDSKSFLNSTATDDFYGLMDPNEGATAEGVGLLDIGIGRLTCKNLPEVTNVVNKIENYYRKDPDFKIQESTPENCNSLTEPPLGDWRNWAVFIGDDEDQATHMSQADQLSNIVQSGHPSYNIDKIYLDAYQQFSTPGGQRIPDAAADLLRRFKKGALIFNYTGHGGEIGITGERILDVPTINALDNFNKLPLFVTATCEFSRYDDPGRTSAGELCLLNPKGGAIALLTTCRLAFSSTNFVLNTNLYSHLFKKLPNGRMPALGDIIQRTKAGITQSIYYANFHLLGDPAMPLAYPQQKVITSKINNSLVTPTSIDTISALAKITVSGFVADTMGNKLSNFNGIVYPTVFDKEESLTCLLNDGDSYYGTPGNPFTFNLQKNILFRGKAQVTNGDFSFTFIVPKDISFSIGPGKISYYATNGLIDAAGYTKNVKVGGGAKNPIIDNDGPQLSIYLNDKGFVSGGTTNEKPILYANLTDSSGINTVGSSIGHDISVILDQNSSKPTILNDYYEADLNSYQSGKVRFPFEELTEGSHRLTFKAWDIQNNSSITSTDFVVAHSAELALTHVLNYPNPFTTNTKFFLEHNQACNPLKITIQIFTISGKIVKTIQKSVTCEGFRPEGVDWDGKDEFGDKLGRGVYIYKLAIINTENQKAEKTEKLVILN
ncbi:MAG: type IX secretion system sortase PorU [Bacteroidota bacterium]|nr:type IX secretion system sortase PorU [Bacteroidota bacterium]MDP3145526.1 type IX secretion system sortase PorU [Bacteroidota bacterium]